METAAVVAVDGQIKNLYPTWQEASRAAAVLGIKTATEYKDRRKENLRLPAAPDAYYADFPGYKKFLARRYATWQEASLAAFGLGIQTST